MKGPMHLSTVRTGRTLRFQGTSIAGSSIGSVFRLLSLIFSAKQEEWLTSRTDRGIVDGVIRELGRAIIPPMLVLPVEKRNRGSYARVFNRFAICERALLRVAGDVSGSHTPAKANVPQKIEHGLVLHDLCRGHEQRQDQARLSAIDHIVGLVAQMQRSSTVAHRSRIRICCADPLVSAPLIPTAHLALLRSSPGIPIMPRFWWRSRGWSPCVRLSAARQPTSGLRDAVAHRGARRREMLLLLEKRVQVILERLAFGVPRLQSAS